MALKTTASLITKKEENNIFTIIEIKIYIFIIFI